VSELSDGDLAALVEEFPRWSVVNRRLVATIALHGGSSAAISDVIDAVSRVQDHHALVECGEAVTVTLWSHDVDGLTGRDRRWVKAVEAEWSARGI